MKKFIDAYGSLISKSAKMFFGKSYYHVSQPQGKHFVPDSLSGYYNDFTQKTDWNGEVDESGIPLNVLSNSKRIYFPITIAQMALGHYDLWLENNKDFHKESFLKLAVWLKENQDEAGGWINPWEYLRPSSISNYSSMAQAEAISTLLRAYLITEDSSFVDSSWRAYHLMIKPMNEGGTAVIDGSGVYLEEYPESPRSSVLNGWIYSAFGIRDLLLQTNDTTVRDTFEKTIGTLKSNLGSYDTGYWSYYDMGGLIASPFYHTLHISLLDTLYIITNIEYFRQTSERWLSYNNSFINRTRALGAKAIQRIKDPELITITK